MPADGKRLLVAATAMFLCSAVSVSRAAGAPAAADSVRAAPAAADSARAASAAADTTRVANPPVHPLASIDRNRLTLELPELHADARSIDVAAERKLGAASIEDAIRFKRAVSVGVLPLSGPTQGSLPLPDGGGPIRLGSFLDPVERSTDEPLIGSVAFGWGAPWLAFALNDPRAEGSEALDLDSLRFSSDLPDFRGPGEALTRPDPRGSAFAALPGDTVNRGPSRTTLVYQSGDGNAQLAGIRFQTTAFRRRLYASYIRNQANGWAPLKEAVSARYALRAELGRIGSRRFDLEGLLHERSIEDSAGGPFETTGRSEWDRRRLVLSSSREGARSSDRWRIGVASEKETWVMSSDFNLSPDAGSRERWEFPSVAAEGSMTWRPAPAFTWIASLAAASHKVTYRVDSLPAFTPRREDARVHVGGRLALGPETGVGLDAAYDARGTQVSFWDARASLRGSTGRVRGRVDLESAHERPSWVDLLTPARLLFFVSDPAYPLVQSRLFRSGNPGLKPRRLSGAIGSAGLTPVEGLDLDFSGSYRRVTDDFGWNVSADTSGGFYDVSSVAGARGSGWLSHAAFAWEFRRGPLRARGVGWIRGGPDSLSPQSGSPPRRALDAAVDLRLVFFKGDLPLRLGVESHARGPRQGLIREAGQVTWDGSLSADFGPAGAFLRVRDVFDRKAGSAIWDPASPPGSPLPGRMFQAGVAWNLLD